MSLYHVSSCQTAEDDETLPLKRFSRLKIVISHYLVIFLIYFGIFTDKPKQCVLLE